MMSLIQRGKKGLNGRRAKAFLLLGLFLSVFAMANSATLHRLVHHDAGSAEHHCAATLLASGQVDAPGSVAQFIFAPVAIASPVFSDFRAPAEVTFNLSLSRGPPALLS